MDFSVDSLGKSFRVVGSLGEGSFSNVYKLQNVRTGEVFAVKKLKRQFRSIEEATGELEINVLKALQGHPNIVKLVDVLYDSDRGSLALVLECLDLNLYEMIEKRKKPYDEKTALVLVYQILKGIAHMHSLSMFHRDIKPENCMVDQKTFDLKLVDFGSTKPMSAHGPFTEYVSTRWYRAPECILTAGSYGPGVDIWAVGCILYEIMTSKPLFPGKHELDQISRIHDLLGTPSREVLIKFGQNPNTQIDFIFPTKKPQSLTKVLPFANPDVIDLLGKLLTYDPVSRISADDALKHPAFEQMRRDEQRWQENGSKGTLAQFLLQDNSSPQQILLIRRPIKMLGKPIFEWRPQPPEQKTYQAMFFEKHKRASEETLKDGQKELSDSRRAAAQRIKAYNQKFLAKKPYQPKVCHALVIRAARSCKSKMAMPPPLIIGHPFFKKKPEIVKPTLVSP